MGVEATISVLGTDHYLLSVLKLGLLLASLGFIYVFSQVLAGKIAQYLGEKKACIIAYAMCAVVTVPLPLMPGYGLLFPWVLGFGFFGGIGDFSLPGLLSISAPDDKQGFLFGVLKSGQSLSRAISPMAMGALYDANIVATYIMSAALFFAACVLVLFVPHPSKEQYKKLQEEVELGQPFVVQENTEENGENAEENRENTKENGEYQE